MGALTETGFVAEVPAVPAVAGGALVAVLDPGVDLGEPASVTVRVTLTLTVAVGAAVEADVTSRVRVVPEPHAETSAATPSREIGSRHLGIVT